MRASNSGTPVKVVILPLLVSLSWKRLQIGMGMLPITTSTGDEFSVVYQHRWLWKTLNFPYKGFFDFCDLRLQRTLQEWTAAKWLETVCQFANMNCYRRSRISWVLAHISCYYSNWRSFPFLPIHAGSWRVCIFFSIADAYSLLFVMLVLHFCCTYFSELWHINVRG